MKCGLPGNLLSGQSPGKLVAPSVPEDDLGHENLDLGLRQFLMEKFRRERGGNGRVDFKKGCGGCHPELKGCSPGSEGFNMPGIPQTGDCSGGIGCPGGWGIDQEVLNLLTQVPEVPGRSEPTGSGDDRGVALSE